MIRNVISNLCKFFYFIVSLFFSYFRISSTNRELKYQKKNVILISSKLMISYNYFLLCFYQLLIKFNKKIFGLILLYYIEQLPCFTIKKSFNLFAVNLKFYFNYLNTYYNILKFLKYKYFNNIFSVNIDNSLLIVYLFFYYKQYFNNLSFLFYYKFFILLQNYFFNVVYIKQVIKNYFYGEINLNFLNTSLLFEKKFILNSVFSKKLNYKYLKSLKNNPVIFFLYNDFFFKKEYYKFYYLNTTIFQLLKKKLIVRIPNYYFFFCNFLNLLNLKKYDKFKLIEFQKNEKIYSLNKFIFIQNFELSLYMKNEVKNIYNYIGHFIDRTLFDFDQYLSMLDENLFLYIDILLDNKKLKISEINENIKIEDIELYFNFDKLFFFFVENGSFYINYYLFYFIYNIFNYFNIIQLNQFKFISTNEVFTYVENSMMSLFKLYYFLLIEDYNFFNTSFYAYFSYNRDSLVDGDDIMFCHPDNLQQPGIFNNPIADYTVFFNLNYYVMNKNYFNNKPDFIDQQFYTFTRFEQKNFYLSDFKLIDNCFKIYFDINILNNYKYLQKYKIKSKNETSFTFKNAYFLTTNDFESEQQYSDYYDFYKIDKTAFAKFRALNDNKFFF